ncbi:MAG: type II toxin-antitoxin system antitoxin SocA domain-containing protein [Acetobacter orientalis]|uniref:type VI toxin-antitoxin system SocA family antitoxin n=1 Tax=Acetobacter orientalis TaxID=146474 RepID=UPI0039E9B2A9
MQQAPYDPRAVANKLLDMAEAIGEGDMPITPLALQKLLYLVHFRFLAATGASAMKGAFEAWQFGPVHPAVYKAFSDYGRFPITGRAKGKNLLTGETRELALPADKLLRKIIGQVLSNAGYLPAPKLVDLSHARNGPWDYIWKKIQSGDVVTRQIPDDVTLERGRYMVVDANKKACDSPDVEQTPNEYRTGSLRSYSSR